MSNFSDFCDAIEMNIKAGKLDADVVRDCSLSIVENLAKFQEQHGTQTNLFVIVAVAMASSALIHEGVKKSIDDMQDIDEKEAKEVFEYLCSTTCANMGALTHHYIEQIAQNSGDAVNKYLM